MQEFENSLRTAINDPDGATLLDMIEKHNIAVQNRSGQNYLLMVCASNLGLGDEYENKTDGYDPRKKPYATAVKLKTFFIKLILKKAKLENRLDTIVDQYRITALDLINSNNYFSVKDKKKFCILLSDQPIGD